MALAVTFGDLMLESAESGPEKGGPYQVLTNLAQPDWGDMNRSSKIGAISILGDAIGHIEWATSLKDGIAQAQKQGKPLVCVYEEDNCGWCKKFDQELAKPAAAQVGNDAIFVKIHPSKDAGGKALAAQLGIDSYPTVSILDINGTNISERSRSVGFVTAADFAVQLHPSHSTMA
jgi:hypothetical protein